MNAIFSYLDDLGITSFDKLNEYMSTNDIKEIFNMAKYLRFIIDNNFEQNPYSPFSFVPSGDISGTGGCSGIECRIKRATQFSYWSALYADTIYLSLEYITSAHFVDDIQEIDDYDMFIHAIKSDIAILLTYKSLIEHKIVKITPSNISLCPHCLQEVLLGDKSTSIVLKLEQEYISDAKITICDHYPRDREIIFLLENLNDFFPDHPSYYHITGRAYDKLVNGEKSFTKKVKTIRTKQHVIRQLLQEQISETSRHSIICKELNSKCITSAPIDLKLFEFSKNTSFDGNIRSYDKLPKYDMPFVKDTSLDNIIRLREIESDSFNRYRLALNCAIKEAYANNDQRNTQQIFDDIVYPQLLHLNEQLHKAKSGVFKKTFSTISINICVIVAGIYTGIIPKNYPEIITAMGGISTLIGAGHSIFNSNTKINDTLRENDFYFLWKLLRN